MEKYNHKKIEKKWQKRWQNSNLFKTDKKDNSKEKFYLLDMFPYPSGSGLHMGHTEQAAVTDALYRFYRMNGKNVLHPQGFDSFGLPAENFAIKTGIYPSESTKTAIAIFKKQMNSLGLAYDFTGDVITSEPNYYKWTQFIFGKFFENKLVYKKNSKTNWCNSCNTIIANEQVKEGKCERCGAEIEQKYVPSWMFKITDFADDLINDLDKVDWPESTIKNQRNWIGKSQGAEIKFKVKSLKLKVENENLKFIKVFTTRPDTLFGSTFIVLAPEHELITECQLQITNYDEVKKYIKNAKKKTDMQRVEGKEKTGIKLEGIFVINPANNKEISIFISDYVLSGYGSGAIMAVPAHDERDFEFAKKYNLEIIEVISGGDVSQKAYVGDGILINSGEFNGWSSKEAIKKITEFVKGKMVSNYRLRDWSISRQRYWGCPIPIVYSPDGQPKFVGEENLPWLLPTDVDFIPTGEAPLAKSKELKQRVERIFGKGWTPEVDTMDTFVDSSWYFLRYLDPENDQKFALAEVIKHWMPVDLYIGGAEHTCMHLLYARFFIKAMKKIGLIDFDEPFIKLRHQGIVRDKVGKKMSKSKGNVVSPDEMIERFGADATRAYMLFVSPLEDDIIWNEENIIGVYRFLEKVWNLKSLIINHESQITNNKIEKLVHKTIKKVSEDIKKLKFNTAISALMILVNEMEKQKEVTAVNYQLLIILLSPFAPHLAEELWAQLGNEEFILMQNWPKYDLELTKDKIINLVIQVNGKLRDAIEVAADISEEDVKKIALKSEKIKKWLIGKEVVKIIFVKGKLLNIVVK